MIALFELFLWLTYIYDIRRQMQIYGAHGKQHIQYTTRNRETDKNYEAYHKNAHAISPYLS